MSQNKDNKTLAIKIRFYTNDLHVTHDTIKTPTVACWDCGVALIEANKERGISANHCAVQCFEDIIPAIKELFRKAGVVVVSPNRRPRVLSHRRRSE